MADFDELFVHELDTPQTGCFEELYLRLDEQVERYLGHKQAWARAGGVPDCGTDVLVLERLRGLDVRQRVAKDVIENVVDSCATRELLCGNVNVRALDGRNKVAGKLGHEPENECALLCNTAARLERDGRAIGGKDEPG